MPMNMTYMEDGGLVGERDTGIDVQHVRTGLDLRTGIGFGGPADTRRRKCGARTGPAVRPGRT